MKLKNVLFIVIAILTIGLFVACNDEVVAAKDNNVAYTQVLESNGAFEYNGTKYETLQDAIEAIDKAKGGLPPKTIKVLRDGVKTGAATVPTTTESGITLDLNGNSLSFLSSTGVIVNGVFKVTGNGEITLDDKSADATAFAVGKGGKFTVENTTINVADQYAVKAAGQGAEVTFGNKAAVAGNIAASDSAKVTLANGSEVSGTLSASDDVTAVSFVDGSKVSGDIFITSGADLTSNTAQVSGSILVTGSGSSFTANKNNLNADLAMADKAEVTVQENGRVHIVAFADTCTVNCSADQTAQVVADADVTIPSSRIKNGFCYVVNASTGEKTYYSLLSDAISAVSDGSTITYVLNHTYSLADYTTVSKNITIDLSGCKELATKLSVNTAGKTLTIKNTNASAGSSITGNLGNNGAGNITIDNVTVGLTTDEVADAVNITGALISTRSTFNATVIAGTLTDGEGSGTAEDPYKNGSTFNGTVNVSGNITLKKSIIAPSINGDDDDFVRSVGSITMYNVAINNGHVGVFAAQGGSVSMTNSTGTAYKIIATNTGNNQPSTVTINNSHLTSGSLTVVDEVASRAGSSHGNVYITGRSADSSAVNVDIIDAAAITISHATVTNTNQGISGARARSGNFISDNCVFNSVVEVWGSGNNLTDGDKTTEKKGSTFKNGIRVDNGSASFYSSTFNPSVNETQYTGFSADSVTIKESVFSTRTDEGHEGDTTGILYNITADKTVSSLSSNTYATNLTIENSTGYVGSLNTTGNTTISTYRYYSDILVDNSSISSGTLSVSSLSSTDNNNTHAYLGDVTVKGNSPTTGDDPKSRAVTVGSVSYADDVNTSYAIITGDIGSNTKNVATVSDGWTYPSTVAGYSTFNGNIYASGAGTFNNSTFDTKNDSDKNVRGNTLSFTSSTFVKDDGTASYTKLYALTASGADPDLNTSALKITTSTGSVASLTAKAGSITVDNNAANANLTVTGAVSAYDNESTYYDVTLTGPTTTGVALQVGAITGKKVDSTRATVTAAVVAKANVVSKLSLFQSTVTAETTVADGTSASDLGNSEFQGNISAKGAITLYGSKFSETTAPTINSEHAGNIGLYNCTGSVGNILSKGYYVSSAVTGSITIDNSKAKANLNAMSVQSYYDNNTDGDYDSDTDTAGTVEIVAPDYDSTLTTQPMLYFGNTSHNLYRITGSVTLKDGSDYTAGTLVLYGGSGHEIEGNNLTIYGGQYGDAGDSFYYTSTGTIKIHGGTCYINEVEMLQAVLEKVVGNYNSLEVDIILGDTTFMLTKSVKIGGQSPYLTGKNIYIHGGTSTSPKTIMVPYYNSTNYRSYAINLASGNLIYSGVVIEPVSLSSEITEGFYTCPDSKIACTLAYDDPNGVPSGINGSFCGGYVCKY